MDDARLAWEFIVQLESASLDQLFYMQLGSLAYTENVVPFFKVAIFTGLWMLALSFIMTWAFGFWGMLTAPLLAEATWNNWHTARRGFIGHLLTPRQFVIAEIGGRL